MNLEPRSVDGLLIEEMGRTCSSHVDYVAYEEWRLLGCYAVWLL
jgi:hypothetical protein